MKIPRYKQVQGGAWEADGRFFPSDCGALLLAITRVERDGLASMLVREYGEPAYRVERVEKTVYVTPLRADP